MKNKSGWKKITEDVVELVRVIDMSMDKKQAPMLSINKAIKAVTGIRTSKTIANIRESNYDFATYKDLTRSKNPSAYNGKPVVVTLNDIRKSWNNIIAVLDRKESKVAQFLQNSKLPFYNGTILVIELVHRFHIKTLEKDIEKIESAIEEVLGKNIRVRFKVATDYKSTLNIKPVETNHWQGDLSAFRQAHLTLPSEEESYIYRYLKNQGVSIMERITILNNLMTTCLIFANKGYKQEEVK